jgi:hypothetical protein
MSIARVFVTMYVVLVVVGIVALIQDRRNR